MERRDHNRKAEWRNNIEKELQALKGLMVKIHHDSLSATLKKFQIGKRQSMMAYMDSVFKKIPLYP